MPIASTCSIGYPHDGRADNAVYRHDRRADKRRYRHDRRADSLSRIYDMGSMWAISEQAHIDMLSLVLYAVNVGIPIYIGLLRKVPNMPAH